MAYIPGELGIRHEGSVAVTENGYWVRVRRYVTPEPEATARRESTTLGGSCKG